MISTRADLLRYLGEITPHESAAYAAVVDVARGARSAITPAQLILACRSLYAWRRDILRHDAAYLDEYRHALAVVCAAEVLEAIR